MDEKLVKEITKKMEEKSTEELLKILKENNKEEWLEEAFESIRIILVARNEIDRRGIKTDEKGFENNITQQMTKKEFNDNAQYDPKIIYEFAARLYSKANTIITIYTIIGALLGGILGYIAGRVGGLLFGLVIFGLIGFYLGREKAFWLKLQAQTSLCQAKIEENTRKQT